MGRDTIRPHPAFDATLLPGQGERRAEKRRTSRYYPREYLKQIEKWQLAYDINMPIDIITFVLMLVTKWTATFLSVIHTLQPFESPSLSMSATIKSPAESIFLRKILILEGLAWVHGLAAGYVQHLRGLLIVPDTATVDVVGPLLAEFQSHRMHLNTFMIALQPGVPMRVLVLLLQAFALPPYMLACLVYPPACHSFARMLAVLAFELYVDAAGKVREGKMPVLTSTFVPESTTWFYGLKDQEGKEPDWGDVMLCIAADDLFHATYNATCAKVGCCGPMDAMSPLVDENKFDNGNAATKHQ